MKRLIIIETAEELLEFANRKRFRRADDTKEDSPMLPLDAALTISDDLSSMTLKADGFQLSPDIRPLSVVCLLIKNAGLECCVLKIS